MFKDSKNMEKEKRINLKQQNSQTNKGKKNERQCKYI